MQWNVICEPVDGNSSGEDGKNEGGLVIYLQKGTSKPEVSRVAYNRKNGSQPRMGFDKALQKEIEKAQTAARVINELDAAVEAADRAAEAARTKALAAVPSGRATPLR